MQKSAYSIGMFCLLANAAWADHSPKFPWPVALEDSNPLSTLTINGVNYSVAQGFPAFDDGTADDFLTHGRVRVGSKTNIFLGMKLWKGATFYVNPALHSGYTVGNQLNSSNYVNSTSWSLITSQSPYIMVQRMFLKQVIDIDGTEDQTPTREGGRSNALEDTERKLEDKVSKNYLTIIAGKFGAADVFDGNIYAHDPSRHFLNSAFNGLASLQYQGDKWGMSYGTVVEWYKNNWTARAGYFQGGVPSPGTNIEPVPFKQYMLIGELEHRYNIGDQPGNIKLTGYRDYGFINNVIDVNGEATPLVQLPLFTRLSLQKRTKLGVGVNVQQQVTDHVGFFMRVGLANKAMDFNDITHTISAGVVASGELWNRPLDEIGIGAAYSGMKGLRINDFNGRAWLGTGAAYYTPEKNLEAYYKFGINDNLEITTDYQLVQNPNFEKSRGPAHVFGLRLRANF